MKFIKLITSIASDDVFKLFSLTNSRKSERYLKEIINAVNEYDYISINDDGKLSGWYGQPIYDASEKHYYLECINEHELNVDCNWIRGVVTDKHALVKIDRTIKVKEVESGN